MLKPQRPEKLYVDVIMMIDNQRDDLHPHGKYLPFSIWEIADSIGASRSQVARIIRHLVSLGLVFRLRSGWNNRIYKVTKTWTSERVALEKYELSRMVGRSIRR